MRPWRITGILLLLACLVLVTVPPLRQVALTFAGSRSASRATQSVYEAVALASPGDAQIWFGYASLAQHFDWMRSVAYTPTDASETRAILKVFGPQAKTTTRDAYVKAIELAPESAAVRFRYAVYLLSASGDMNRADEFPSSPPPKPLPARTAQQSANLQAAENALVACQALAPDNAACDYLLAWAHFAEHQDAEALAAAQSGARKVTWSCYEREAALAQWQVFDRLPTAAIAKVAFVAGGGLTVSTCIRSLAGMLASTGDRYRANNDHRRAIAGYESAARLGHLMRVNAYSLIDGLVAVAVTRIAARSSLVSVADTAAARAITDGDARVKRQNELHSHALASYLRGQGRGDFASFYEQDSAAALAWQRSAKTVATHQMGAFMDTYFGPGIATSFAILVQCALFAALALLVGLAALITRCWRYPVPGFQPTYRGWLLLLVLSVLPGLLLGLVLDARGLPIQAYANWAQSAIPEACGVGLLMWLIGVGITARRQRAALPPEERPGRARSFFTALCSVVAPTLAALVLLSVIGLWPLSGSEKRTNEMFRAIADQGEVKYWGISGEQGTMPKGAGRRSDIGHRVPWAQTSQGHRWRADWEYSRRDPVRANRLKIRELYENHRVHRAGDAIA